VTAIFPPVETASPTKSEILPPDALSPVTAPVDSTTLPADTDFDEPVFSIKLPLPLSLSSLPMLTLPLDCDEDAPLVMDTDPQMPVVEGPLVIDMEPPVVPLPADSMTFPAVPEVDFPDDIVTDPDEPVTVSPECKATAPLLIVPDAAAVNILIDPLEVLSFVETPLVIVTFPPVEPEDEPPVKLKLPP
jgi:hypothetical protein